MITYELQNVYAPHVNSFSMPESFISWTCFQHNRKCCFLLSSCRFCCWLYLCILTSSLNSSFCYLVNIYFSTSSLLQGICRTNIPLYSIYMSVVLWYAWFNCWPEQNIDVFIKDQNYVSYIGSYVIR